MIYSATPYLGKSVANTEPTSRSVLFLVTSNQRRGAELEALQIYHQLRQRGCKADLVALAPSISPETLDIFCLGDRPLSASTLLRLRRLSKKYDVIVAYGGRTLPACAVAFLGRGRGFVYRSIGSPTAWIRSPLHRARTSFLLRSALVVVALWDEARQQFIDTFGCLEDSVTIIPNLRSPDRFVIPSSVQRSEARKRFGMSDGELVVATVGVLAPEKRVDRAILAVSRNPEMKLLVVGDGPLRTQLNTLADSEARGKVTFTGELKDVLPAYHASDALLLTSDTEGMPGVLIEAGMTGLPIISVDVGAVRWMSNFSPLLTVVAGNAVDDIAASLKANVRHRNLSNSGQFKEFSTDRVVTLWEHLLRGIDRRT